MIQKNVERFFYWINERHRIFRAKAAGQPWPWTSDPILQKYKFTNAFRELDKTTVWMREHLTKPNEQYPAELMIFNCCVFRMFGTMEMSAELGFIVDWNPERIKEIARERLANRQKVFTGAYIITNQGLTLPKQDVVVDFFLQPVWVHRKRLAEAASKKSLEHMHETLGEFHGWGGGGFMSYEVVTDLNHTNVMRDAADRYTWANAGPGAKRGLNRIHGRPLESLAHRDWNAEMADLLAMSYDYLDDDIPLDWRDMRMVEHSLCEFDKYMRVLNGEGTPRSLYRRPK